ncbi:MAG TPA: hypothetical protein VG318_16380 [Actinomycetota bacterium]|nr:hypothetical protein [Actinomycetota bacterium]
MGKTTRRPVVRSLFACGVIASSMLVLGPSPAQADICTRREQPGLTVTVAGAPVRVPSIYVEVCRDISTGPLAPMPEVVTSGSACHTGCLAILLRYEYADAGQNVSVTYELDGDGSSRTVWLPIAGSSGGESCVFGVGVPSPPASNCLVSIDPDD